MQRTLAFHRLFLRLALSAGMAAGLAVASAQPVIAQTAVALPAPSNDIEYAATRGDTMIGISRRYLIEGQRHEVQRALWEHNKLRDKDSIAPGQVIRIPENWLKEDANSIELAHVEGDVQSKGAPLRSGAKLAPGDDIKTGTNGYVTIKLSDGSTLVLQPGSDMAIDGVKKSPIAPAANAQFSLTKGRVEASVPRRNPGGARFEVRTPIAVAAVRGTRFRVTADDQKRTASSEVIEGTVQVNDTGNIGTVAVAAGFGTKVSEGQAPLPPRALLAAPRLWTGIRLWVRRPVQLNFTRLQGAVAYRVLVARKADFADVISEIVIPSNVIALPDMENGAYFVKVRGIDDIGLEGRDTQADLVLSLDGAARAPGAPAGAPAEPAGAPSPAAAPASVAPPAANTPAMQSAPASPPPAR
ncbi:MAG: FecR domain-containing protein [Betaproteobacteria bacterium]